MRRLFLAASLAVLPACSPRPHAHPPPAVRLPVPPPMLANALAKEHFGVDRDVRADTSETGAYVLLVYAPPVSSAYPLPRASYVVVERATGRVLVREDGLTATVRWLDAERVLVVPVPGTVEVRPDVVPGAIPPAVGYTVNVRTGARAG